MFYNYMLRDFNDDYNFGIQNEEKLLDILRKPFPTIKNTKELYNNPMCSYDMECDDFLFELKSRRNAKNKFPTTFFEYNKTLKYDKLDKKLYIFFMFSDGIYYILYDKELFSTFDKRTIQLERTGIYDRPSTKCLVPVSLLKPLDTFGKDV